MNLAAYIAVIIQTLIAAGTFLVAKDAHAHFTALELVWFRILLSGFLVVLVYAIRRGSRPRPKRGDLLRLAGLGLLGVILNQGFFLFGLRSSTPLHAALIYALTPVLVLLGSALWFGRRATIVSILGVFMAVAGVFVVLTAQGLNLTEGPLRGDLLILAGMAAWAAYTLLGKPVLERFDAFTVIVWVFGFAAVAALPAAPWVLGGFDFKGPGWKGWSEILYLSAMTSGVSFTLWYYALGRLDPTRLAVFTNVQAPLTALLVWIVYGTLPSLALVLGGVLVILGVTAVQIPSLRALNRASSRARARSS